jgi:hypothetical protein
MSARIASPTPVTAAKPEEDKARKAAEAGRGFEAILVRQMLASANVAGKSGYADMAVEAIADAVTSAGGLGLGRAIEDALSAHGLHAARAPADKK